MLKALSEGHTIDCQVFEIHPTDDPKCIAARFKGSGLTRHESLTAAGFKRLMDWVGLEMWAREQTILEDPAPNA